MSKRTDLWKVLFDELVFESNSRISYDNIEELSESIAENGVLQPLICYKVRGKDSYIIKEGHRRYIAVQMAIDKGKITADTFYIPVVLSEVETEDKRLLGHIICNTGMPLTMLEEALVYEKLMKEHGYTKKDMHNKTKKSITHINNCFDLLKAPMSLRTLIIEKKVSATHVVNMMKNNTPEEVERMVKEAIFEKTRKPKQDSLFGEDNSDSDIDGRETDNTKVAGLSGMGNIGADSGDAVRITAKDMNKKPKPRMYTEAHTKNFIARALVSMGGFSEVDDIEKFRADINSWFNGAKNKDDEFRYFEDEDEKLIEG